MLVTTKSQRGTFQKQQEGHRFNSQSNLQGPDCVCVASPGSPASPPQSKDMRIRASGKTEASKVVNVSAEHRCLVV